MPYADIGGRLLVVTDTGGDGPPVVFGHGASADAGEGAYESQVRDLSDVYRVLTWRAREDVDQPAATDAWDPAVTLFGLLDALGIERAVLCGAADAAEQVIRAALLHPDRVRALVLLHGHLPRPGSEPRGAAPAPTPGHRDEPLGDRLEELAMPTLLIHGDADASHPVADAQAVADAVSDPRGVIEVPDAAGALTRTHPELVTTAIRDYLEGLPA